MKIIDRITGNPFRMLGGCSNSGARELSSNAGKFKAFSSVKKTVSFPADFERLLGPVSRTVQEMEKASLSISTPEKKLAAGMFWFFQNELFTGTVAGLLAEGNAVEAALVLKAAIKRDKSVIDMQNLMIISAIRGEYEDAIETAQTLYGPRCTEFQKLMTEILTVKKQYYVTEFIDALHEQGISLKDHIRKPDLLKWQPWLKYEAELEQKTAAAVSVLSQAKTPELSEAATAFEKLTADLYFVRTSDEAFKRKNLKDFLRQKMTLRISSVSEDDARKAALLLENFKKEMRGRKTELSEQITAKSCMPLFLCAEEMRMAVCDVFFDMFLDSMESMKESYKDDTEVEIKIAPPDPAKLRQLLDSNDYIFRNKSLIAFWHDVAGFISKNAKSANLGKEISGQFSEILDVFAKAASFIKEAEAFRSGADKDPENCFFMIGEITHDIMTNFTSLLSDASEALQMHIVALSLKLVMSQHEPGKALSSLLGEDDDSFDFGFDDDDDDDGDDYDDYGYAPEKKKPRRKKAVNGRNNQKKKKKKKKK
ncbi:MAG: hypothetical protein VZR11_00270 [Succinimonas sp.]|nr:hypothetical protein [Succinimonas sp.]